MNRFGSVKEAFLCGAACGIAIVAGSLAAMGIATLLGWM